MPIPAGVEKVTVTDGGVPLTGPDGAPLEGHFLVAGPDLATVAQDDFLFGGLARRWVQGGRFDPLTLVATDAVGINPAGFSYSVVFTPKSGPPWTRYFTLPKATPSVVLADILIPDPVAGSYSVLADASTLLAKAANLSDVANPATARGNLGITGLLAALLPLAGGTLTGDLTVDGANLTIMRRDRTGAFRFRVTGSGLDLEIAGLDVTVSSWSNPDFTGTQSNIARWEPAGPHMIGKTQFGASPFNNIHSIDAVTGVAALGAKNGLTNIKFAGLKGTAGAPTTGTWAAGDTVLDSAGAWHFCTAGGTPGTWT